jgi:hypothetical protein
MAPMTNIQILQGAEAKIEAVRCTPETTMTRWLYFTQGNFRWTFAQDILDVPTQSRSFHAHKDFALGRYHNTFSYEEIMTFEDLPWWLRMILKGGSAQGTGTTTGSTPPGYTYQSTPSSTVDDLDSFTMKYWEPSNIYKIDRCMVDTATLAFDAVNNPAWIMTLDLVGRTMIPGSTYDAVADRNRNTIRAPGTKLYIDEPAGTIGTTLVTGKLRSGSITIDNQLEMKQFSEDAATDSCDVGRGEQLVTGEVVLEFKDDVEFAKMRAGTSRKLRFEVTGPQIGTTPTTTYLLQIDIPVAYWMAPTMDYAGNNKIQTFGFMGFTNATSPQPISIKVVNALATIAA